MAARPTPRDGSGARPRSTGGSPTSCYAAGTGQQPARSSFSGSPVRDRPTPSFLRPTVSSSMHSSYSTSALPFFSKSCASTPKRSTDTAAAQTVGAPRPTTDKVMGSAPRAITLRRSFTDKAMGAPGAIAPKRPSTDKAPVVPVRSPRPVTPPAKAKAQGASRCSAVVPRRLMQRSSSAINGTTPRSKTGKDVVVPLLSGLT